MGCFGGLLVHASDAPLLKCSLVEYPMVDASITTSVFSIKSHLIAASQLGFKLWMKYTAAKAQDQLLDRFLFLLLHLVARWPM